LRSEHRFPLLHGAVLGRLDREGRWSIGDLAAAEKVRPQSMAQAISELEKDGLVRRRPDPADGRRVLVEITKEGRSVLTADRRQRVGWLVSTIEELTAEDQEILRRATAIFSRMSEG
jgi:DNA-binding MarR family transcriptional regulator